MQKKRSVSLILSKNTFYGHLNQKYYKRERTFTPDSAPASLVKARSSTPVYAFNPPSFISKSVLSAPAKRNQPPVTTWYSNDMKVQLMNQEYLKASYSGDIPSPYLEKLR